MARSSLIRVQAPKLDTKLLIFRSIARAVNRNDVALASTLLASAPVACAHLCISAPVRGEFAPADSSSTLARTVSLVSAVRFRQEFDALQVQIHEQRIASATAEEKQSKFVQKRKRLKAYVQAERRRGKLLSPSRNSLPPPGS